MANFEKLINKAEQKLHFNEKKLNDDPLRLLNPPEDKVVVAEKDKEGSSLSKKKKKGWLKSRLKGKNNQQQQQQRDHNVFVVASSSSGSSSDPTMPATKEKKKKKKLFGGALETLEEEERGEVEEQRGGDDESNPAEEGTDRANAPKTDAITPRAAAIKGEAMGTTYQEEEEVAEVAEEDVAEGDDESLTDSIVLMRMQNSEEYTASVCSLRSLSTFEKDFVNNITEQQAVEAIATTQDDEVSVSTFEQDFMMREANGGHAYPTQVFTDGGNKDAEEDDLTMDGSVLSETTFERDARLAATSEVNDNPLPLQITTAGDGKYDGSDETGYVDDDISETTFEADQRQRAEALDELPSSPSEMATMDAMVSKSNDSELSVSTFEKDAAALQLLTSKIGRKPSTNSKKSVVEDLIENVTTEESSTCTFEEDMKAKEVAKKKSDLSKAKALAKKRSELAKAKELAKKKSDLAKAKELEKKRSALSKAKKAKRKSGAVPKSKASISNVFVPNNLGIKKSISANSTSTFEEDMRARSKPKAQMSQPASKPLSKPLPPLSPVSMNALADQQTQVHQMMLPRTPIINPPQQLQCDTGLDSPRQASLVVSPLSVQTVHGPGFLPDIQSSPSRTAFENDTVKSNGRKIARDAGWSGGGSRKSSSPAQVSSLAPRNSGSMSMSGFEKDARAGMKSGGTVYPMNHVPAPSVRSAIDSATVYDGAAPMSPNTATPEGRIGLSVAAQRALTAENEARLAAAALPKISPLVMELSPNAIDRGVKLRNREGSIWSRFLCFTNV